MDLEEFCIPFSSLKHGSNPFHFKIDKAFFEFFNNSTSFNGDLEVVADVRKETHLLDLRVSIKGSCNVDCDRCLDQLNVVINQNFNSIIKFDHVEHEIIKDDVVYIPYESYEYNIAFLLYENFTLSFPKRNIHKENGCNPNQIEIIQQHSYNNQENKEDIDPRWNALKKLKEQ
mgnify:FL=1